MALHDWVVLSFLRSIQSASPWCHLWTFITGFKEKRNYLEKQFSEVVSADSDRTQILSPKLRTTKTAASYTTWGIFIVLCCQTNSKPRLTIRLNDLVNLNSNSASRGSTPRSGGIGRVISTQLWLLHWSSRQLQSEPNHSPHYRLQGQISVGGPQNQA